MALKTLPYTPFPTGSWRRQFSTSLLIFQNYNFQQEILNQIMLKLTVHTIHIFILFGIQFQQTLFIISYLFQQKAQKMKEQDAADFIAIVIKIFQNVGIKRWIDKIQALRNQQIYFQICKVIIPQSMIKLFKLAESNLTTAQKIQGVINIVQETLKIELYHISGQAIAQGKLSHTRNFLHILEALSQTVGSHVRQQQVESAPENTRSLSDINQEGHYTVIGINKQFHNEFDQDQNNNQQYYYQNPMPEQISTRRNKQSGLKNNKEDVIKQSSDSQSNTSYLQGKNIDISQKKQNIPQRQKKKGSQVKLVDKPSPKYPKSFIHKQNKRNEINISKYQLPIKKDANQKLNRTKKAKSVFIKKTNSVIQKLQEKKLIDQEVQFNQWVKEHRKQQKQNNFVMNYQSKQRIQFTNQKIDQREKIISTMKGQKNAIISMENLFYQQKAIWKGIQKGKHEAQLEQIEFLIGNYFNDETLLREALVSGSSQIIVKPPNRRNIRIQI